MFQAVRPTIRRPVTGAAGQREQDRMTVTSDLRFFDANCIVGTRPSRHPATPSTLSQYLVDYEYYDLHAGLVRHAIAVHYAPDHGNRRLMAEIAGHPRLVPCWVVMPHHTYEIAPAEDLVAEMLSLNVRAAVMYPKSMGFGTSDVPNPMDLGYMTCLLYTSDAADDPLCVVLGGRRFIKKKTHTHNTHYTYT